MFGEGLRPSELPDLGVPQTTLYRYFEDWKKRHRNAITRAAMVAMRRSPQTQADFARAIGLEVEEVAEALERRNPLAAVFRKMRANIVEKLERIDSLSEAELDKLAVMVGAYRGRERIAFAERFAAWANPRLMKGTLVASDVVLLTLAEQGPELRRVQAAPIYVSKLLHRQR